MFEQLAETQSWQRWKMIEINFAVTHFYYIIISVRRFIEWFNVRSHLFIALMIVIRMALWVYFYDYLKHFTGKRKIRIKWFAFVRFLKHTLDQYVENDYTLVYFHYGLSSLNKPSFGWLRQAYGEFDRK